MSEFLTTAQLDALDAAAEAAIPGPWTLKPGYTERGVSDGVYIALANESYVWTDAKTAAFIYAADPVTVRALIAEIRARRQWDRETTIVLRDAARSIKPRDSKFATIIELAGWGCPPIPSEEPAPEPEGAPI